MAMLRGLLSRQNREARLNPVFPSRQLRCPYCEGAFEASRKALTLKCPHCANRIEFRDVVVTRSITENISTMGVVHVNRKGSLRGVIDCGELIVQGRLAGTVEVRGLAQLDQLSIVTGHLHAEAVRILPGARFEGELVLGPIPPRESTGSRMTRGDTVVRPSSPDAKMLIPPRDRPVLTMPVHGESPEQSRRS
ncbi:MAG: polymer-forming cytoskeletal protein [Phycisphaerales bacterium]|nr:MAG: polymer-forming cytoskeletal protein [Phycisphaerales bacterium]